MRWDWYRLAGMLAAAAIALGVSTVGAAAQGTLRIGIADDPDTLDPVLNRSATGRLALTALCDRLFDYSPDLKLVTQLASGYAISPDGMALTLTLRPGVRFHDGEPLDAEAVKFNLERGMTMTGSLRRAELSTVAKVAAIDPLTVRIDLKQPQSSLLLATLAERAGMMISPKAAAAAGDRFGTRPVCSGPFKFVERIPQGRIVVERFADYWDKDRIFVDRVEYLPISDSTVRAGALRSGDLQIIERLTPTDLPELKKDTRVVIVSAPDLGFHMLRFNTNNGDRITALGRDARIRQAISLAIDREVMVQSLFNGDYQAGNQFVNPRSAFYNPAFPVPPRDLDKARALLREAGVPNFTFTLLVPSERERQEAAQFIQAMLAEAGITMKIETMDSTAMGQQTSRGQFEAVFSFWSGRVHPDGNVAYYFGCSGYLNDGKYCTPEMDDILSRARTTSDAEEQRKLYHQATAILQRDMPAAFLFHRRTFTGLSKRVAGFEPHPDSVIRLQGVRLQ